MSNSVDRANLQWIFKNQNKNEILELLQKKVGWAETSQGRDIMIRLIFQNENLLEKDVIELLETFLDQAVDPNIQNNEKLTMLHLAMENRWKNVVELLIRHNADILACDRDGNSMAHHFIVNENSNFRKFLNTECNSYLSESDIEMEEMESESASTVEWTNTQFNKTVQEMEKMESESASFVEWMVFKGFDFDVKNDKGESALHLSINYNLHHILLVLLKYTQQTHNVDSLSQTLLHLLFKNHPDYRRIDLIDEPIQIRYAAYRSRYATKLVKLMLDRGVCAEAVDVLDEMCIQAAIEVKEDMNVIKILIDHLMKRCSQSNVATTLLAQLFKCIQYWGESRTEYFLATSHALINLGANVNAEIAEDENKVTLLYYVFNLIGQCNHLDAIKFLDDHGADFSALTTNGENLFHALASIEHDDDAILDEPFELLLSKGCCDVNARNEDGDTPLHFACERGYLALVKKLLKYGAEVNCQNESGETALHCITDHKNKLAVELAECLLKNGADANIKDDDDKRPLFYVAGTECSPLVSVLLKWGAYANICDTEESPFYQALTCHCKKNTEEMLACGADINDPYIVEYVCSYGKIELSITTLPILLEHWIKLKVAGLVCAEKYNILARSCENYEKTYQKCLQEIEKLKGALFDIHTSVYNFLHMNFNSRRIYMNNEELKNIIDSADLKQQFPQYFVLILASYRLTVEWEKLLEPVKQVWHKLTYVRLPDEWIERTLGYLQIKDLVNMVECEKDL